MLKMSLPCKLVPFLDYNEEEGLLALRHLELEAYVSIVNALRAQGPLTEEKKSVLKQLQVMLGISTERHKAEIRRAVNCENLSTICYVVHGSLCETSWLKEGRRLINVLKRSTPINAYVEIANKVAKIAAKENEELLKSTVGKRRGKFYATGILHLPQPDLHQPKNVLSSPKVTKDLLTCDAFTSTEDLYCNLPEQTEPSEAKSFVYLPGGTTVHLEREYDAGFQKEPDHFVFSPTMSNQTTILSKRQQSNTNAIVDAPFIIKEVFKPNSMQTFQKHKRSPMKKKDLSASKHSQQSTKLIKFAGDSYVANKDAKCETSTEQQEITFSPKPQTASDVLKLKTSLPRDHTEQFLSNTEKAGSIIPQAPVPPEHLYAVGASRTKASVHTQGSATWATKNTTTTHTTKIKKRIHRSPMQHLQRKIGIAQSRIGWTAKSTPVPNQITGDKEKDVIDLTSGNEASTKLHQVRIGNETFSHRNIPIHDSLFLSTKDCSPQKVFRPSICMTGVSLKPHKPELASFYSEAQPSKCTSVETGLAPVSSIVSRVSSPAEPMMEHVSDSQTIEQQSTILSTSGKVKMIRTSSSYNPLGKFRSPSSSNMTPGFYSKPPINPLSRSLPSDTLLKMCHEKDYVSGAADGVTFEIKSLTNAVATTAQISATKPWKNESVFGAETMDVGQVRSSVTLAASGLCALAAGPVLGSDSKTPPKLAKDKNPAPFDSKQLPTSGSNIIKVAPRAMQSKVTQIQGHRNKPSIIVVHRPPGGKPVAASPAKFLEIGSKGMQKPFTQVKTFGGVSKAITVPVSSTTTIVKPVPTKIVSVPTNVRTVSGKPLNTNFHKVITKGKMQQLVLKPTSSIVAPIQKSLSSSNKSTFKEEKLPFADDSFNATSNVSDAYRLQPTMPMHAATTIKALMAIQMSSPQSITEIDKINATVSTGSYTSHITGLTNVGAPCLKPVFKPKPNLIAVSTSKPSKVLIRKPIDEKLVPILSEAE